MSGSPVKGSSEGDPKLAARGVTAYRCPNQDAASGVTAYLNASTSARVGSEGWAPARVTEIAAAQVGRTSGVDQQGASASLARAPLKASPAAVASTAWTRTALMVVTSPSTTTEPVAPRVTMQLRQPNCCSRRAAATAPIALDPQAGQCRRFAFVGRDHVDVSQNVVAAHGSIRGGRVEDGHQAGRLTCQPADDGLGDSRQVKKTLAAQAIR